MKKNVTGNAKLFLIMLILGSLTHAGTAVAAIGTISDTDKYAWSETSGWQNFKPRNTFLT